MTITNDKCVFQLSLPSAYKILDENSDILVGKILTIVEGSALTDRQSEAIKKTIKQSIWSQIKETKTQFENASVKKVVE